MSCYCPLLELKFYEHSDNISASWIATRIKRIGKSRQNIFREKLGYIKGSQTLVDALAHKIKNNGQIILGSRVSEIKKFNKAYRSQRMEKLVTMITLL